jgi:hypothetical protein
MDQTSLTRIENDPNYLKLVSERKSLGWTLTIITLVMYYGYIAVVAFDRGASSAGGTACPGTTPRCTNFSTRCRPIKPVAPVINIRFCIGLFGIDVKTLTASF